MASRLAPLRALIARRPTTQSPLVLLPRRTYSTKPSNPTKDFYKTFTRPVAKVLLMAVFTYQLVYFGWMTLEAEDIKAQADETIEKLEGQVEEYKKKITVEGKSNKGL